MTEADLLRKAAALMRERAEAAQHPDAVTPGAWITEHHNIQHRYHHGPDYCHIAEDWRGHHWTVASEVYIPVAEHMAGMDPRFALAVADDLARAATWRGLLRRRAALAVARAYLGEPAPASPDLGTGEGEGTGR